MADPSARLSLARHMDAVRGKPPDDRDAWGKAFVEIWVSPAPVHSSIPKKLA
jgi:hypothetical protein